MNAVEQLLSDTADYFQARLTSDAELRAALQAMLHAGQSPKLVRGLHGIAGGALLIGVGTPTDLA